MRIRVLLVGTVLVVAGCTGTTEGAPVPGNRVDAESLRVTAARPVAGAGPARLSPDGTRLMRLHLELCVMALDGSGEQCVDQDEVSPDSVRAQWSPDGTRIAFTDNFWQRFLEPDVWMFDTRSGELRNLTDDGVDQYEISDPDPDATVDLLPSWSPDGKFIRFARGGPESDTMSLMSLDVEGGEVAAVREIECGTVDLVALAWSVDRVAWTCGVESAEVRAAELARYPEWTVMPGTDGASDEDRMLLSFSPDGGDLLVDSLAAYGSVDAHGGRARVVSVEGGDPEPVAEGQVGYPSWAPSGGAIAYVDLPGTLMVVAEPGAEPRELHSAKVLGATDGMRLNWAPNALLAMLDGKTMLLTLAG